MVDFISNNWLIISFLAPLFWALVNIIDVYFVNGVYKDATDGAVMVGLFQILPGLGALYFVRGFDFLSVLPVLGLAVLGGFFYNLSFYYYFKALFRDIDVALFQILWSLTVVVVPILAFLFLGERLTLLQYAGMGIVLFGCVLLSLNKKIKGKFSWNYFGIMILAVIFTSLSMILEDSVYSSLGNAHTGFFVGFAFFSFGGALSGIIFAVFRKRSPLSMLKKYYKVFVITEFVQLIGVVASQRAISIAPSVSFVAVVETFIPVFILIFSSFVLFYMKNISKKKTELVSVIYREQIQGVGVKIIAAIIMSVGVYILN